MSQKNRDDPLSIRLNALEQISAVAQNGLHFSKDKFDIVRYEQLRDLVAGLMASLSELPKDSVKDWLTLGEYYATPKMDVRGLVLRGDTLLLVQEKSDDLWSLPGGWCDINASVREAVEREVLEETGLQVKSDRLLALYDKHKHDHPPQLPHAYKCFVLCHEAGGELVTDGLETHGSAFFKLDALPGLSLHRNTEAQLRRVVAIAADPASPTDFD